MNAFDVEAALAGAIAGHAAGATIHAGAIGGDQAWPRVLVKTTAADLKSEAPWRGRHSAQVIVQSAFDSDNAALELSAPPSYAAHRACAAAIWARLEQREALTAAMGAGVVDARLEQFRTAVDARQGLFMSILVVEVETN